MAADLGTENAAFYTTYVSVETVKGSRYGKVAARQKERYVHKPQWAGNKGSANMRVRAKIIAVAVGLLFATSALALNVQEYVRMVTHVDLVMHDGGTMHAMVVKMHGKMYVMIPVDELPDYLHQQVLKVMH